jgi:Family of unknown function (DUF6206)
MHSATASSQPSATVVNLDIDRVDAAVEEAVRRGVPGELRVLGYGELTLVIGWPSDEPALAVKRLPPFADRERLEAYVELLDRYVQTLRERGVRVAQTEVRSRVAPSGSVRAYLVQPLVAREHHLNVVLQTAEEPLVRKLFELVVDKVHRCADESVGFDAQAANWWLEDDDLAYFDVSTPLLRDETGREQLDVALFLSVYPWLVRPVLARVAPGVMAQYHEPRVVLLDFASNLHKEGFDRWVPALLDVANERLGQPLGLGDVRRYFRQDKALWALMQRLRLADRAWQRHVRRRPYPLLLPPRYRYGPPQQEKEHRR